MAIEEYVPKGGERFLKFLDQLEGETRQDHEKRVDQWDRGSEIIGGAQSLWGSSAPFFLANLIGPTLERKEAMMTEAKPTVQITPRKDGLKETCNVLTRTIQAGWDEQGMLEALDTLAQYRTRRGCAYIAVEYDAAANYGVGDIVIRAIDPRLMQIDPAVKYPRDLDEAQSIIEHGLSPLSELQARYPEQADRIKPNTGPTDSKQKGVWSRATQAHSKVKSAVLEAQRGTGGHDSVIPRCYWKKYWFVDPRSNGDGGLKYPNGRVAFRVGDTIINEDTPENPYYDGRWPYVMIDQHSSGMDPFGCSDVTALRRIQEAFNRSGHHIIRALVQNSRGWNIYDNNAITPELEQALKDLEYIMVNKMTGREFNHGSPPIPPTMYMDFMRMCQGLMEFIAGISDAGPVSGKGRVELRSSDMLEGLQTSGQAVLRRDARSQEAFLERVGIKWISRIFQYYTADRLMTYADGDQVKTYEFEHAKLRAEIVADAQKKLKQTEIERMRDGGEPLDDEERSDGLLEAIKGGWRLFRFRVTPLSSLAATKVGRAQMMGQLVDKHMLPAQMLLKELGFDNAKELVAQAQQEAVMASAMGIQNEPPKKGGKKK